MSPFFSDCSLKCFTLSTISWTTGRNHVQLLGDSSFEFSPWAPGDFPCNSLLSSICSVLLYNSDVTPIWPSRQESKNVNTKAATVTALILKGRYRKKKDIYICLYSKKWDNATLLHSLIGNRVQEQGTVIWETQIRVKWSSFPFFSSPSDFSSFCIWCTSEVAS